MENTNISGGIKNNHNYCSFMSCEKLDRVACWVGSNVATAFFASLERCSCINLNTTDSDDVADDEEAKDRPLMLSKPSLLPNPPQPSSSVNVAVCP